MESYVTRILHAKYEKLDLDAFIATQTHLDEVQKDNLKSILRKHEKLFDGTLGVYPHKKVHIELHKDAKPVHARAYPRFKIPEKFLPVAGTEYSRNRNFDRNFDFVPVISGVFKVINVK